MPSSGDISSPCLLQSSALEPQVLHHLVPPEKPLKPPFLTCLLFGNTHMETLSQVLPKKKKNWTTGSENRWVGVLRSRLGAYRLWNRLLPERKRNIWAQTFLTISWVKSTNLGRAGTGWDSPEVPKALRRSIQFGQWLVQGSIGNGMYCLISSLW